MGRPQLNKRRLVIYARLFKTLACAFCKLGLFCLSGMEQNHNILLLDNDEQSALDIQRFLKVSAYTFGVSHVTQVQEGLGYLRTRKPDVVLLDAQLAQGKDYETLRAQLHQEPFCHKERCMSKRANPLSGP